MATSEEGGRRVALLWTRTGLRVLLAAVLGIAGALKLPDPAAGVRAVRAYELLPESLAQVVGHGLPVLEVGLAVLLLVGLATRAAAAVSAALLVAFMAGIVSAAARGLAIDCGCFGGGGQVDPGATAYTTELVRDAFLLAAALVLVRWPASRLSLDALLVPAPADDEQLDDPPHHEREAERLP